MTQICPERVVLLQGDPLGESSGNREFDDDDRDPEIVDTPHVPRGGFEVQRDQGYQDVGHGRPRREARAHTTARKAEGSHWLRPCAGRVTRFEVCALEGPRARGSGSGPRPRLHR